MDKYCDKCGTALVDGLCPKCLERDADSKREQNAKFKKMFVSPTEKVVAILGNSYVQNFMHDRSIRKGFAVVSDKRVYFKGKSYEITGASNGKKRLTKYRKSRVVDLENVSGAGFDNYSNVLMAIMACIFLVTAIIMFIVAAVCTEYAKYIYSEYSEYLEYSVYSEYVEYAEYAVAAGFVLLIPVLICFFLYLAKKKSIVVIQYAGGVIGFDKRWFTEQEVEQFQKQLFLAKDKAIEKK